MLKLMNALKNRKGFTLMELIVVLIILAILIAALTPVLIGWINDARETALRAEGRTALMAIQTIVTEAKGTGYWPGLPQTEANRFTDAWERTSLTGNQKYIDLMTEAGMSNYVPFVTAAGSTPGIYSLRLDVNNNVVGIVIRNTNRQGHDSDGLTLITPAYPVGFLLVGSLGTQQR